MYKVCIHLSICIYLIHFLPPSTSPPHRHRYICMKYSVFGLLQHSIYTTKKSWNIARKTNNMSTILARVLTRLTIYFFMSFVKKETATCPWFCSLHSLSLHSFPFAFMANARLSVSYPSLFDFSLSFKQSAVVWKGRQKISCLFSYHCLQKQTSSEMEPFYFNKTTI